MPRRPVARPPKAASLDHRLPTAEEIRPRLGGLASKASLLLIPYSPHPLFTESRNSSRIWLNSVGRSICTQWLASRTSFAGRFGTTFCRL